MVTSNHIHLLVYNNKKTNHIPESIRLNAGRVGQEYNNRKQRKGVFWADRYHATAVENGAYELYSYIHISIINGATIKNFSSSWNKKSSRATNDKYFPVFMS